MKRINKHLQKVDSIVYNREYTRACHFCCYPGYKDTKDIPTGFPAGPDGKESALPANAGNPGSVPGSKGPLRNDYPCKYSCLEDSMARGACWTAVHGVAKSWT